MTPNVPGATDSSTNGIGYAIFAGTCQAVFLIICIAVFWSMSVSRFVPSPEGDKVALGVALVLATLNGLWAWKGPELRSSRTQFQRLAERFPVVTHPIARTFGLGCVMFGFTFIATEGGFLDWWTLAFGQPGERVAHVAQYETGHRLGCGGYELRETPFLFRPAVCATLAGDPAAAPGTPITLYGKQTAFGTTVERFQIGP